MRLPHVKPDYVALAFVAVLSGWAVFSAHTPHVVTFDKPKLMARFVGQLSAHALSDEALRGKTEQFSAALKMSLNAYAKAHHVLVLNAADVLAGERDITANIERDIARYMRGHA